MKTFAFVALVTLAFGSTLGANYCGVGKCASCVYVPLLMEDRSCTYCVDGPLVAVGGNTLASKCDNEGKPANCMRFAGSGSVASTTKVCEMCNEGFNFVSSSKTCVEQTTKIENGNYYVDGVLVSCKSGYYQDSLTSCVKATEIKDCQGRYYKDGSTVKCSRCNKGFVTNPADGGLTCITDPTNGCDNAGSPCLKCAHERGWYAVDFDLNTGNKCEYSARTLALGAIFAFVFALMN